MLASNLIDSLVAPSRVHSLQFSCQPGTIHHDCLIVGKSFSPVMLSHEQRVENNQIQLFVDPEVSSKEAVLKRIYPWVVVNHVLFLFLLDPGVSRVRSMGSLVSHSLREAFES